LIEERPRAGQVVIRAVRAARDPDPAQTVRSLPEAASRYGERLLCRGRRNRDVIVRVHCCQFLDVKFVNKINEKASFLAFLSMLMLFTSSLLHRKLVITDDY
jgi:hypothetical protein